MKWLFRLLIVVLVTLHCMLVAQVRAVIFDFGGVVVNADRRAMLEELELELGIPAHVLAARRLERDAVYCGKLSDEAFWKVSAAQAEVGLPEDWEARISRVWARHAYVIEGMLPLVVELQELGYLTPMLSDITALSAQLNEAMGFYDLFSPRFLSCEMGCRKPNPLIFEMTLAHLELLPEECLFVDDRAENVAAAQELGFHAVQFQGAADLRAYLVSLEILPVQ